MKKQVIVGHSGNVTMQPSEQKALMYECSAVERRDVSVAEGSLVHSPDMGDIATDTHNRNSVGNDYAAFGGCNANNGNASASTLNSNNALSNSNGNYAGAFAVQYENNGKHVPVRVLCEGNTYYFEGYHTTEKEALDILRSKFNF